MFILHNIMVATAIISICLMNRFSKLERVQRLLGTQVSLIGATTNTTCGTINAVNSTLSLEAQTYTIPCPSTKELTLAIFLYDDVKQESLDNSNGHNRIIMNLVEVMVYVKQISK